MGDCCGRRGEFPHWADSMAIPLMGVPVLLAILLVWAFVHLVFVRRQFYPGVPVASAFSRHANIWLLFVSALTAALVIATVLFGEYWYALPGCLWIYFYLALAASRLRSKESALASVLTEH
jgi:hypothetical protein